MNKSFTKLAFFALLIFAFTLKSNAQWRESDVDGFRFNYSDEFYKVQYADSNTIFTYSANTNISDGNHVFYKSENGNDFQIINKNYAHIFSFSAVNKDTLFSNVIIDFKTNKRAFIKSEDGGKNWKEITLVSNVDTIKIVSLYANIHFFDNKHGFIVGDTTVNCHNIWTTSDAGDTWKKVDCSDLLFSIKYENLNYFPSIVGYGSKGNAYYFNKGIADILLVLSDYGNRWEERKIFSDYTFMDITFKDSLNGIATRRDTYNNIAITNDGGLTWDTLHSTPDIRAQSITYAKPTANKRGFYICAGKKPYPGSTPKYVGSYVSFDDGKTWEQLDEFNHSLINFYNAEIGLSSYTKESENFYPVRFFEGIPKGFAGIKNNENQTSILVYPNPTKEAFFVEIETHSSIEIFDVQGKLCKKVLAEKGKMEVKTDELKSGTYFIKITDQKNTFNQKLIITE